MSKDSLKSLFHDCMPLFIALGDEIRLTIIESLATAAVERCNQDYSPLNISRHGMNVREITEKTSLSRPAVSHHLKLLKDAGLIDVHQEGTSNYYYLTIADSTRKFIGLGNALEAIFHIEESFS